jgi:hypothetical protein
VALLVSTYPSNGEYLLLSYSIVTFLLVAIPGATVVVARIVGVVATMVVAMMVAVVAVAVSVAVAIRCVAVSRVHRDGRRLRRCGPR